MKSYREISLCQPDSGKGCSVCCGLFNFKDISRASLTSYLSRPMPSLSATEEDRNGLAWMHRNDIRDVTSHICPYQGFLSEGKPGCRIHPAVCGNDNRDQSLFGKTICDRFLCPAHKLLDIREKQYLKTYIRDWYCYAIAIVDPGTFSYIVTVMEKFSDRIKSNGEMASLFLEKALLIHGEYLLSIEKPVFYYSVPEYISHRDTFWIGAETERGHQERGDIHHFSMNFFT